MTSAPTKRGSVLGHRVDLLTKNADKLAACRVAESGVACGYCHNCGARLPRRDDLHCPRCYSSDYDE